MHERAWIDLAHPWRKHILQQDPAQAPQTWLLRCRQPSGIRRASLCISELSRELTLALCEQEARHAMQAGLGFAGESARMLFYTSRNPLSSTASLLSGSLDTIGPRCFIPCTDRHWPAIQRVGWYFLHIVSSTDTACLAQRLGWQLSSIYFWVSLFSFKTTTSSCLGVLRQALVETTLHGPH